MRIVNIEEYDYDTMQLAKPVYDNQKRILLASGRHIHPKFLGRLKDLQISHLFVEDNISKGITLDEMIDMPTWMDSIHELKSIFHAVEKNELINIVPIQQTIGKLIIEVRKRPVIVLVPTSTISDDLKLYAHSVNVALLSIQIGQKLLLNQLQLRDLAIGALLHDIGKVKAKDEKEHPAVGFNVIRNVREVNLLSAHVAFQHHESLDGSGYPRGISGDNFHQYAQIVGIANLYENMISNKTHLPHDAMELLMTKSGQVYNTEIVHAFVQGIPAYPPGTKVELSTNDDAIVTRIQAHMQRPVVRIINSEKEIQLEEHPTIMINGVKEEG